VIRHACLKLLPAGNAGRGVWHWRRLMTESKNSLRKQMNSPFPLADNETGYGKRIQ
jgi:hypothetical protein